jgi:hypothetical protein
MFKQDKEPLWEVLLFWIQVKGRSLSELQNNNECIVARTSLLCE